MSDPDSGWLGGVPSFRKRVVQWASAGILVFGLTGGGLIVAVRGMIDAQVIERRLNDALGNATDGRYVVKLEGVEWSLLVQSLHLRNITLRSQSSRAPVESSKSPVLRRIHASIPGVHLQNLDVWDLLWHKVLQFEIVLVQRPQIAFRPSKSTPLPADKADTETNPSAPAFTDLRVDQLRLQGGTLIRGPVGPAPRDSLWGLSLQLRRLSVDSLDRKSVV